jgi:ribosomal protein S18 acetylase RimI-like enzyme
MEILKLNPCQKERAANVLAAAFFDYPMFTHYFPDPQRRRRSLSWYMRNVLNCALRYGEVHTDSELTGVIFTLPPGHTKLSIWEYIRNGFLLTSVHMGIHNFARSQLCEDFVSDMHERIMAGRPHYYLWGLAVDPGQQRSGIGKALMEPFILKAGVEQKPIYLETHEEKNVAYYQKMGFNLVDTGKIPDCDLQIWCMVRNP